MQRSARLHNGETIPMHASHLGIIIKEHVWKRHEMRNGNDSYREIKWKWKLLDLAFGHPWRPLSPGQCPFDIHCQHPISVYTHVMCMYTFRIFHERNHTFNNRPVSPEKKCGKSAKRCQVKKGQKLHLSQLKKERKTCLRLSRTTFPDPVASSAAFSPRKTYSTYSLGK